MSLIKNFSQLSSDKNRAAILAIIEEGLKSIQPAKVLQNTRIENKTLKINGQTLSLADFKRVFLLGFGKGSAGLSFLIEKKLVNFLTYGLIIDQEEKLFQKLEFSKGTHPLSSQGNIDFTKKAVEKLSNLNKSDLVITVICGGGSAMFELPHKVNLTKLNQINKTLIFSGATISQINTVRKHLSDVKGGSLAKLLYPARVISLIFSDVPGNDLSVIASGPTVCDKTTIEDVKNIIQKYGLEKLIENSDLTETPKEIKYFRNVSNILMLSNKTALLAMQKKATALGLKAFIYSDRVQAEAKLIGKKLINQTKNSSILLAGGETTIHVRGKGRGGRNQALVLSSLPYLKNGTIIVALDSDGIDFYKYAGAMADGKTLDKAKRLRLDTDKYNKNDDSASFFEKVNDGILTGKLGSNVSDLMLVFKK